LGVLAGIAPREPQSVYCLHLKKVFACEKKILRKSEDLADLINEKIDDKFDAWLNTISGKVKKSKGTEEYLSKKEA